MRVLFAVFPEPGHLHPMIEVAHHLERCEHEVAVFSTEDLSPRLAAVGLVARAFAAGRVRHERQNRGRGLAALLGDPALARGWYRYVLVAQVPAQIAALRAVVATFRPDVLVVDALFYAGAIVAEQAKLPWAAVSTQLLALAPPDFRCPYLDHLDALAVSRDRLFADEGVDVSCALGEAVSPWLFTVFATEALGPCAPYATPVGPVAPLARRGEAPPFPWDRLRGDVPLVYASFGSQLAPPPAVHAALVNALDPDEADLVIATGDAELPPTPPHVTAVAWAPQLELLDRARAMVTHGGANSVAECLARGVPSLVVPLGHEQPLQAHLIERAGAGLALAPEAASTDTFATALRTLLADGTHRRRAAEIRASYAAADGARTTAELVIRLAETRAPVAR